MARVVLPETNADWIKLFRKLKAKDLADGLGSIIRSYMTENAIVLTTDEANINLAEPKHQLFEDKEGEAEKLLKILDEALDPIIEDHKKRAQFLKKYYRHNVSKVSDFGITINGNVIVYPTDRDLICAAIKALIDHHNGMAPGTSPMTAGYFTENTMNIVTDLAALPGLILQNAAYTTAKDAATVALDISNGYMIPIEGHVTGIGQFLVGYFHDIPEKATDWGFTINHSPQSSVIREGEVDNLSSKTLSKLLTGGDLICTGPGPLKLFRGKTATGAFVLLTSGQHFKIVYGYGTVTLKNEDPINGAGYEGEFNQ